MGHDEVCDSLRLYANDVMPRLQELTGSYQMA
jgi:hypothetical protein